MGNIAGTLGHTLSDYNQHITSANGKELYLRYDDSCPFIENEEGVVLLSEKVHFSGIPISESLDRVIQELNHCKGDYQQVLSKIRGHFSLIYFSKSDGTLLLTTDRIGTHPLYYHVESNNTLFSSRLKDIIDLNPELKSIAPQSIYQYIYFHCIPAPDTIYKQVKKLKASEYLCINNKPEFKTWYIADFSASELSPPDLQKQLLEKLEASVVRSTEGLNLSTTGAFLSGGLDSSTVSGFFAKQAGKGKAKTFTIGFEAEGYDESEFAQITADHFQTDHSVYYVTPEDIQSALTNISAYYDEPFGNSSALPAYYCAKYAKSKGIDVLLAGDGGDELFAGNERYAKQKVFEIYFNLPEVIRKSLIEWPLSLLKAEKIPFLSKVVSYVNQANTHLPGRLHTYNFLHQFNPKDVFEDEFTCQIDMYRPAKLLEERYHEPYNADTQNKMLYLDWKFTLADNDLVKVSNMCHLAGVDVKYPMLDDELVLFSAKIPSKTLLPGNQLRHFYKLATKGFLSDKTLNKSKKGFGLPFGVWLKERPELRDMAYDNVRSLKTYGFFKESFLEHAIEMHSSDHPGYFGELIWILMMLNLWLDAH